VFVAVRLEEAGQNATASQSVRYGVGVAANPATAAADALVCAVNRLEWGREQEDEAAAA